VKSKANKAVRRHKVKKWELQLASNLRAKLAEKNGAVVRRIVAVTVP